MNYKEFKRGWHGGLPETKCGAGSTLRATRFQRKWLPVMVAKYGIKSIADIGAGDLNWIRHTLLDCDYTPYDLIPRAHGVKKYDILTEKAPEADCLMVLWVINHLEPEQQKTAMNTLLESGARYLIMTWDKRMESCTDLPYLEKAILKHSKGVNFEIRLIDLQCYQ